MENIRAIHKKMKKIHIGRRVMRINVGDLWNSMKEIIFFLKVISKLGINRMFKTNKLSQRYIGLYQILSWVVEVANKLASLPSQFGLHDVFHVSQLRKFVPNLFQLILLDTVEVAICLTFNL